MEARKSLKEAIRSVLLTVESDLYRTFATGADLFQGFLLPRATSTIRPLRHVSSITRFPLRNSQLFVRRFALFPSHSLSFSLFLSFSLIFSYRTSTIPRSTHCKVEHQTVYRQAWYSNLKWTGPGASPSSSRLTTPLISAFSQ